MNSGPTTWYNALVSQVSPWYSQNSASVAFVWSSAFFRATPFPICRVSILLMMTWAHRPHGVRTRPNDCARHMDGPLLQPDWAEQGQVRRGVNISGENPGVHLHCTSLGEVRLPYSVHTVKAFMNCAALPLLPGCRHFSLVRERYISWCTICSFK